MTSELRGGAEFPLVPLKNVVVFPRTVVNLVVGRPKSVAALEDAMSKDKRLVVSAQRSIDLDDPGPADVFPVGTLVEVIRVSRQDDGNAQVVVEGLRRVSLQRVVSAAGYLRARTVDLVERLDSDNPTLLKQVSEQFERYARLNRNVPQDAVENLLKSDSASKMSDLLAAHLPIDMGIKQQLLESLSPVQRLERVALVLANEIEIQEVEQHIRSRVRQQMDKNQREYYLKEQLKAIHEELGNDHRSEVQELLAKIEEKRLPEAVAPRIAREVHRLERMTSSSPEGNVIRTYLDVVLSLPWSERSDDRLDIDEAQRILDEDHYGLERVKERIIEFLAVRQLLSRSEEGAAIHGPILCFGGPPGVGKTSLGRSIARALGRKFVRLSLGGVRDEAEIRGHRRTYVGALPGRIIQAMRTAGTVNPVILLDEVDKLSSDYRGDPTSALLEVLDPEQNAAFVDHYLELPYDLSQVMFITTANNVQAIPRPLRDRMEVIEINGYTEEEKVQIGKRFLVPKQLKAHGIAAEQLVVSERATRAIIQHYTREAGVRNLERSLASLCRKTAKRVLREPGLKVRVTPAIAVDLLGPPKFHHRPEIEASQIGVATGMAWTEHGGELLPVEVVTMPGRGRLTITGRLGDVMQESARAALSYARSRAGVLNIDRDFQEKSDLHIHIPEGAVPKDGPSAGITMATALISALTRRPVRSDIAMTGEITLRGRVLPIGGLKEKVLAAHRSGIRRILAPLANQRDLPEIPKKIRDQMEFIWVDNMDQVIREVFLEPQDGDAVVAVEARQPFQQPDRSPLVDELPPPIELPADQPTT